MPNSPREHDSTEIFREHWRLYRKLIDHNYMFHKELAAEARAFLKDRFGSRPLSVLDLGCGDCGEAGNLFRDCTLDRYVGYDLSRPALDLARDNLAALGCEARLACLDLRDALRLEEPGFDLVFSSFALHHLDGAEKRAFFAGARRLLKPDGALLLIDIAREEGEDRDRYLEGYLGFAEHSWTALTPEEFERVRSHVVPNDFPETVSSYDDMAFGAGFLPAGKGGAHTWHRALFFLPGDA
jgi:SAM-dependent methyltransferase